MPPGPWPVRRRSVEQRDRKRPEQGARGPGAGDVLGYGLTWALSTLVFLLLGSKLDDWLGTRPVFTIVLVILGAAGGFYSMYRHLVLDPQRRSRQGREEGER